MKIISKNELFDMIPDKGKSLLMYLGTQTSPEVFDDFIAKGRDYTCERYVYIQLTFANPDGQTKSRQEVCIKLMYSQSTIARELEAKEKMGLEEIDLVLDLNPIEAIIFDNPEERMLHFKTHAVKSRTLKPDIHN